jgi:hypothetical protein
MYAAILDALTSDYPWLSATARSAVSMTVMRKLRNASRHRSVHYVPIASADS